ncbi:MAG: hypothetical protein A3E85_01860 [Gammaproteobacteria bacterium RIFCSPHIGHO2_12_FULL_45_12]|nr:MAG: hypothetical protein A3E85_01860 [Gammaproteobacteria bacterium RIFCSPHIGHO2_12_FULL_45_12]
MPRTILCYGDSNTWGYIPSRSDNYQPASRYKRHERWTGILQVLLNSKYLIVEEGLNSRTTHIDYFHMPDRNGKTYLPSCLYSHAPIDLVILALGGNDAKSYFNSTPEDITAGMGDLINIIQSSSYGPEMSTSPRVLIITPPIPLPVAEECVDENGVLFFNGGIEKIKKLPLLFEKLANEKTCEFLNLAEDIRPSSVDGIHYEKEAHRKFAVRVEEKTKLIFGDRY